MTTPPPIEDLTRWNRAGLDQFRYVDANAATHLEDLRRALNAAFTSWPAMQDPVPPDRDELARLKRLVEQLYSDRSDWGFEITRAFCRALHVTTEHINAFANESYLDTATQWESLRRLVSMIGYTPRPQSSAATPLAILTPVESPPAILPKGIAIKNVPTAITPALVFETEKDLLVDPALNGLHVRGWHANPNTFDPFSVTADWAPQEDSKIDVGQVAILTVLSGAGVIAYPVKIDEVEPDLSGISISRANSTPTLPMPKRGGTSLTAAPKSVLTPTLNGPSTIRFEHPHNLGIGETVFLAAGSKRLFGEVQYADEYAVTLAATENLSTIVSGNDIQVFRTRRITKEQKLAHGGNWYVLAEPSASAYMAVRSTSGNIASAIHIDNIHKIAVQTGAYAGSFELVGSGVQSAEELILSDPMDDKLAGIAHWGAPLASFKFDGAPPKLNSGDWLIAKDHGTDDLAAVRIESVERGDGQYTINLDPTNSAYVSFFYAEFQEVLRPFKYDENSTPLKAEHLIPEETSWPGGLAAGRDIILENMKDEGSGGIAAQVTGINAATGVLETDLKAEDYDGFTVGNVVIRANVAFANDGETKPIQVLGSGDASQTSQSFVFDADNVTHISDPAHAGSVRADIDVWADNIRFTQVDELRNSQATDTHYHARLNEDGHLVLTFGDGLHARRPPSGIDNLQIRHRVGGGEIGNISAYSLSKTVAKVALIDEVRQPVAASGGGAAEPLEDMRRNAPASVQAMNRAVSLKDYEALANRYAGVWHAVAFEENREGRLGDVVVLAIMPAGAKPFLGTLAEALRQSLESRGLPGVPVEVQPYIPARPNLSIELSIDETQYIARDVLDAVTLALHTEFHPKKRRPGRPLHRSEIVAVIESVEGVSSSVLADLSKPADVEMRRVRYGGEGAIWSLWPEPGCAVFIDDQSMINLMVAEATS